MRELIGPSNVKKAIEEYPNSIRALGDPNNNPDNLIHASDGIESASYEIEKFFNKDINDLKQKSLSKENKPHIFSKM